MVTARAGEPDDPALVERLVGGSEGALAELYDRHADAIFALVNRLTSDRGIAEEVVQETFLTLWDRAETFDPRAGSLAAWLHTIARNRAIDRLRAAGRRPTLVAFNSGPIGDDDMNGALDRLMAGNTVVAGAVPSLGPEDIVSLDALRDAVRAAIAVMPDQERTVIVLAYGEDLSQTEIAQRLGWPLGTVKTRTRRALQRLRENLGSEFGPRARLEPVPVPAGEDR
jgi:RNA polymerase sigma-70 factor (ECF subfamily)